MLLAAQVLSPAAGDINLVEGSRTLDTENLYNRTYFEQHLLWVTLCLLQHFSQA